MTYSVVLKPKAEKDLMALSPEDRKRIVDRWRWLEHDLHGDLKKLSNHFSEYRMRAGDWRVLFEVAADRVIVYRILHGRVAYR